MKVKDMCPIYNVYMYTYSSSISAINTLSYTITILIMFLSYTIPSIIFTYIHYSLLRHVPFKVIFLV